MNITFGDVQYPAGVWHPQVGCIGDVLAYDTETTFLDDPAVVAEFVIGSAFDGRQVWYVRRQDLQAFWQAHHACKAFMHTAAFDMAVTAKASAYDFTPMIDAGLVRDISIYYRLLGCAETGDVPFKFNLAQLSHELLGVALEKDEGVRTYFGRFLVNGVVDYAKIPGPYLEYAGRDAIATFLSGESLEAKCREMHLRHNPVAPGEAEPRWGWLGHHIQLRGDIALRAIERNGIHVDTPAVEALDQQLSAQDDRYRLALSEYGYAPGAAGNQAVFDQIIRRIEQERGVVVAVTPKSGKKSQAAEDLSTISDHPFVAAFLGAKETDKFRTTYVSKLQSAGGVVHPRYNLIVRTGRTSCSGPNIQNQPRKGGIRECFIPAPGHVFIACDYGMLELCTLAQISYTRFGHSAMRDLINAGVDLHRRVASQILQKPETEVSKEERQKAKAVNFGLPGGMAAAGLSGYARTAYGADLPLEEAERWRSAWLQLFPEMTEYLAHGDDLIRLGATLDLNSYPNASPSFQPMHAAGIVMRVAGGSITTSTGRRFSQVELDWAWEQIENSRVATIKSLAPDIGRHRGSRYVQRAVMPGHTISIPTSRVRANCSYTESRNWPFQALAADGAKLALCYLARAGYRIAAFIHDEVLVEVPEAPDYRVPADDISRIMIASMREVCPDVAIRTEVAVMRRWRKDAKAVFDKAGRLIPYDDFDRLNVHAA